MNHDDLLRQALRTHANALAETQGPPPAALIYLRAERRARNRAAERATLPLFVMQGIGIMTGLIACAWVLHLVPAGSPSQLASRLIVPCGAAILSLVVGGCWMMLYASRSSRA